MATKRKMDPADYEALNNLDDPNFVTAKTVREGTASVSPPSAVAAGEQPVEMPSATPLGVSGRQNEGRVTGSQIREPFEPIEETPSNPNDTSFTPFQNSPELYSNPFDPGGRETISAEADSLLAQAQSNDELFMFDELPDPTMSQTGVAPARADMKMSVITEPNEFPLFDPPAPQEPFDQEASNREYAAYQEEQKRQALLKERRELLEEDDPTVDEDGFPISENLQRSRREVASENEMMDQRRSSREQARVAQVQERRDLRNWQTEARRAQREGRPVPPMPSQSRRSNTASFSSPGYNASGRMVARVGEATIGVVEDPTQAGKFIPQPGFNSANALSDLAFDIEGQESMDHLLRVAKESGVQSQSIARFDSVQKAAKNLKREDFASDAQFESAKADIKEEYGIVAKQLVDRQKDFFAGRGREDKDALGRKEQFTDDVMREFESAVANRGRDDYDQRSDQEIFRDSIMQVQRRNMLREGLLAQQTGRLTPQQSAQLPVLGFPSSSQVSGSGAALPNQFGVQMENGVAASGGEEQISAFDDAMRAKYEDLPFGITTDQNGGLVIQHNELGAFPGLMVSGYDLPVAISSSPQDEEMFKRAGIPFVKPKNPDQVINQHVDVQERDDGIEEFDINSGTQEARENVAKRAKEQFENAQSFAEDMAEYQSAFDAENAKQKQHSGSFADPQFLIDQGIVRPEKDQTKTGMYDKAVTARNADIQSEYDQEYAEIQRQINEEGLPKSEADIDIRELQKDFDERKSKPMTEQEFMATIGDEAVAEELSRLQQVHEQEQRVSAQVRRKQKNDYGPEFTQAYSRQSTDGSWTYTIRSSPSTFEARPLRSVALGTGAARFPLAEQPSDMAHAAFDIPIVVRTSDGEVMQTVIPSAPFKAATAEMNKATTVIDGVKVDRLAEATVNVANLIQQFYPGEMTRQQLQEATEQMMRRHGYAEDSDFGG